MSIVEGDSREDSQMYRKTLGQSLSEGCHPSNARKELFERVTSGGVHGVSVGVVVERRCRQLAVLILQTLGIKEDEVNQLQPDSITWCPYPNRKTSLLLF